MSDPRLDTLAQTARNRGLKLVRSLVRRPDRQRFGKVGLTEPSGRAVFGMDARGPTATPQAIEDYLRGLEAEDWGASVDAPEQPPAAGNDQGQSVLSASGRGPAPGVRSVLKVRSRSTPAPAPELRSPPQPKIRDARSADSTRLTELIRELGHEIDTKHVRRNLTALINSDEAPLVATLDEKIVGLCGVGKRVVISRPAPLGRITSLMVTASAQGQGIGRMLVGAAEAWMRKRGCVLVEVTSNDRRAEAHGFYRHLGYERTSIRFAKTL